MQLFRTRLKPVSDMLEQYEKCFDKGSRYIFYHSFLKHEMNLFSRFSFPMEYVKKLSDSFVSAAVPRGLCAALST